MGEISRFFPSAKCYAPAPVVTLYGHQYQGKLDEWENVIGSTNLPRTQCECLEALPGTELELEGEKVEIIRCMGDLMWNSRLNPSSLVSEGTIISSFCSSGNPPTRVDAAIAQSHISFGVFFVTRSEMVGS